jgi:hypothetical protein
MVNITIIVVIILVAFIFIAYITRNAPIVYGGGPSYGYGGFGPPVYGYGGFGGGPTIVVNDYDGGFADDAYY